MPYGQYSDDPLEDSLFRDDEMRIQEEMDKENWQEESSIDGDQKGRTAGY